MQKPIAIFITDTHLFEKRTKTDSVIDCNYEIIYKGCIEAINLAQKHQLTKVYHLGDFFDSRKSQTQDLIEMFDNICKLFEHHQIELHLLVGNHDKQTYRKDYSYLSIASDKPYLYLYSLPDFFDDHKNKIRYHFLSYFDQDIYLEYLHEKVIPNIIVDYNNILLTHIGINGVLKNDSTSEQSNINFKDFDLFDKTFVGHFHDPSVHYNGKINYIGGLAPLSFGENANKGIYVLHDDLSYERIKIDVPVYLNYEIDIKDLDKKAIESLKQESKENHIKLIIKGTDVELNIFDKTDLKQAGIILEKKSTPIIKTEIDQQVEKFDNLTLTKQFENFCEKNKLDYHQGKQFFDKIIN